MKKNYYRENLSEEKKIKYDLLKEKRRLGIKTDYPTKIENPS